MFNKRWLLLGLGIGIFSMLMFFAFQGIDASRVAQAEMKPIIIGDDNDFTGPSSAAAPQQVAAMELAIHEFNGQVAGRPVKIIHEDSACDETQSVDKAKKLVERDGASILVGPLHEPSTIAVHAYLQNSGIPHLAMIMPEAMHNKKNSNLFCIHGTNGFDGYIMGKYAAEVLHYKTATVIHDDMVDGEQFTQGAMDAFVAAGGKIIQRQRTPINTMDYAPYLSNMKKADVVFFWLIPPNAMNFINHYADYGLKMPLMMAGIECLGDPMLNQLKDKVVGMYATVTNYQDVEGPGVKKWLNEWKALYGADKKLSMPGFVEPCNYYVEALVALEALKATNGDTSPNKLNDAIRALKLETPWGKMSFNDRGIAIGNSYVTKVVNDGGHYKLQVLKAYEQLPKVEPAEVANKAPKM